MKCLGNSGRITCLPIEERERERERGGERERERERECVCVFVCVWVEKVKTLNNNLLPKGSKDTDCCEVRDS